MASDATKQTINQSLIDLKAEVADRTKSVITGVKIPELEDTRIISNTDQLIIETSDGTKRTTMRAFGDFVGTGLATPKEVQDARGNYPQLGDRLDAMDGKIGTNEQNIQNNSQEIAELKAKHEADMREVIDARTDNKNPITTHNNLKERLDSDYDYLNSEIEQTNTHLSNLYTLIYDVDNMQQRINNSKGSVKFKKDTYQLKSNIFLKSDTIYDGSGSTINMNDFSFILPEFSSNIKLINFNFVGTLKHTKITELLENGTKIKCENNVFDIGDKLGCSNYGITDKPYVTIISFDGTYYKLDTSISTTGNLLNDGFGAVVGNFEWTSSIAGSHNNSHITIKNCKFEYSRGYAISLPESDHVILDGVEIKNNGLDMINLSAENVDRFDLTIENCNLEKSIDFGKQGVGITSVNGGYYKNIKISNSTFRNISESAISFGYAKGHLQDVVIENNVFTNNILFAVHICGDSISIKDNIIQGSQAAIRIADVDGEVYLPTASYSNLFIEDNKISKCLNGIISTQIATSLSTKINPKNTTIKSNSINVDFSAVEACGENIVIKDNFLYSLNNNSDPYYASSIFVNGEHNENVLIDNNVVGGEVNIIWLNTFNMKIQNNTIKADKSKAIRILPKDNPNKQSNMNCVVCNNVIYKSNNMNLSTNDGKDLTEFVDNKLVNGELITIIPYMKGHGCRYEGDGDGIHWISNTDNSWKYTKDRYFESYGKYLYIGSDGTPKITDDITSTQ